MAGEKHLRLQVSGSYSGTGEDSLEVWAFNIRMALVFGGVDDIGAFPSNWGVAPAFHTDTGTNYVTEKTWIANGPLTEDFDPESYLIDQAEPAVSAFISGWDFAPHVQLRKISLYPCDTPTGNAIEGNYAHLTYTSGFPAGAGTNTLPLENSVVVSWKTNRLGPRGKGRIYTPVPGTNILTSAGLLGAGPATDLRDAAVTMLQGLALEADPALGPNIRPVVTGPTAKSGQPPYTQYAVVNGVRVGQVIDTQSRRRNKEREAYVEADVTY